MLRTLGCAAGTVGQVQDFEGGSLPICVTQQLNSVTNVRQSLRTVLMPLPESINMPLDGQYTLLTLLNDLLELTHS